MHPRIVLSKRKTPLKTQLTRLLILITGLLLLVLLIPTVSYVSKMNASNNQSLAESLAQYLDLVSRNTLDTLINASLENTILSAVVSSRGSEKRENAIQVYLSKLCSNNLYIDEIRFYIDKERKIIASDYSTSWVDETDNLVIETYLTQNSRYDSVFSNGHTGSLFEWNGDLYMALDFPLMGERRLGTLFCRLNLSLIKRETRNVFTDDRNALIMLNQLGTPVFFVSDNADLLTEYTSGMPGYTLYTTSPIDATFAVVYADYSTNGLILKEILVIVLPTAVVFILIAVLLVYLFADRILTPLAKVNYLISGTLRQNGTTDTMDGNLISKLEASAEQLSSEYKQYEAAVGNMGAALMDHVFEKMLDGAEYELDYIRRISEYCGTSVDEFGNFCLLILEPGLLSEDKEGFSAYADEFRAFLGKEKQAFPFDYHLAVRRPQIVVLCEYHKGISYMRISSQLQMLAEKVKRESPVGINRMAASEIYGGILDTPSVYRQMEIQSDAHSDGFDISPVIEEALKQIQNGNEKEGAGLLQEAFHRICVLQAEPAVKCELLRKQFDILVRKLANDKIMLPEDMLEDYGMLSDNNSPDFLTLDEKLRGLVSQACMMWSLNFEKKNNKYILKTIDYIAGHYSDPGLSLEGIADELGIHANYLSRLFKESMGINFTAYLSQFRIEQAARLLRERGIQVKHVAEMTGFGSQQNFIKVFKKYTQMTPGQYQQEAIGGTNDDKNPVDNE